MVLRPAPSLRPTHPAFDIFPPRYPCAAQLTWARFCLGEVGMVPVNMGLQVLPLKGSVSGHPEDEWVKKDRQNVEVPEASPPRQHPSAFILLCLLPVGSKAILPTSFPLTALSLLLYEKP